MWWSKPKLTVEEMERQYLLEERTRVLKDRIAQMNKLIDRDKLNAQELARKVQDTPQVLENSQRDNELNDLRAKLLRRTK
jgi:hypothetical protein